MWRTYSTDVSFPNLAALQGVASFACEARLLNGPDPGLRDLMGLARQEA